MKYCQGPKCHTYDTKHRKRGPKGNKVNQTRRRTSFYYLQGNACSMQCQDDWFKQFGEQALNHFGRITQPIVLQENNAWRKQYRWSWQSDNNQASHYFYNHIITFYLINIMYGIIYYYKPFVKCLMYNDHH